MSRIPTAATLAATPKLQAGWLDRAVPLLFVLLWSTGFIAGKAGIVDCGPLHLLLLRFALVAGVLTLVAWQSRASWPATPRACAQLLIAGMLVHGGYTGGVFSAMRNGLGAGEVALIVGLQPLLTAAFAGALLREPIGARRWLGLWLGLAGVTLVLQPRLHGLHWSATALPGLLPAVLALLSISIGTVWQKRFCSGMDLRSGGAIQYIGAIVLIAALLPFAPIDAGPRWTLNLALALIWLVVVLSLGAVGLLYYLLQRGTASRVSMLFYLVPVLTAWLAYLLFNEQLTLVSATGMAIVVLAMVLAA